MLWCITNVATASHDRLNCNRFDWGCATTAEKNSVLVEIKRSFGTGSTGQEMVRCAKRESGLNPYASNFHDSNGGSYGALQINGIHARDVKGRWVSKWRNPVDFNKWRWRMYVAKNNVRQAVALYHGGGMSHWGGGC